MKTCSIRTLSMLLFILLGLTYLTFGPKISAQNNTEGKEPIRVRSIMTFDPSSLGNSSPTVGPEIAPESIVPDTVGANVNASNEAGAQSETDIAIDPTNPNHIVGGSNDIATLQMRAYESFNGGSTWTNTAMPLAPSPNNAFTSDPAVTFDAAGNAYYSYLGVNALGTSTTLVCMKKAAGSTIWNQQVVVPNVNADKNLMTADRTGGTFNNRIYIAWDNNNGNTQTLMVARSSNGGASFTATQVNDSGTTVIGACPAVGPNGEVYVIWSNYASTSHNLFIDRSLDGGVTWGTDHLVHHWVAATGSGLNVAIPADPQRGITVFGFIDVDRTTGPNRGTVYCAYNDATTSNGFDIFLRKSTDGGATWSAARRVNDDPTGVVRDQFMPRLAVDQSDGSVNIIWDDTRNDPNNKKTDIYYARSTDGGNTFAANTKVTTAMSDESTSTADANGYGDYNGIAASGGTVRPLWTDSRSGSEEVFSAAITNTAPAPDFSMSASPSSQSVTQGNSTSYTVSTSALNGFTGSITLSASGLPAGATASFSANPVTAGGSSTMTVSTATSTPTGTSTFTVTGTSGSLTHTATPSLTVNAAPTPNMTLSVSPTSLSITQGGSSGSVTATTTVSGGFNSAVSLSASGMPSGVTAAFNPTSIAAPGGGTSTLTLTASSTATTGTATVTVTASGGGITRTATVSLTVNPPVTPDFKVSLSTTSVGITQGGSSGTATVSTTVSGGFNSAISLSASGQPAGVTASFNPTSIAAPGSGSSTLTLTASSTATTGTFTVTVTASGGGKTHTATLTLTVNPATNTTKQLIVNGGFETSVSPWVQFGDAFYGNVNLGTGSFPHTGAGYVFLGNADNASGYVYQQVTIPSTATSANLTFWLNVTSQETTTLFQYDRLFVEVYDSAGNFLQQLALYSNLSKFTSNNTPGVYSQKGTFSLLAYKGQTILLAFRVVNDFSLPTTFRIDDVSVTSTVTAHRTRDGGK